MVRPYLRSVRLENLESTQSSERREECNRNPGLMVIAYKSGNPNAQLSSKGGPYKCTSITSIRLINLLWSMSANEALHLYITGASS